MSPPSNLEFETKLTVEQLAAAMAPARPVPGAEDCVRLGGAAQLVGIKAGQSPPRTQG